eukprot:1160008-Pelagomonas_calceolata.AAC.8
MSAKTTMSAESFCFADSPGTKPSGPFFPKPSEFQPQNAAQRYATSQRGTSFRSASEPYFLGTMAMDGTYANQIKKSACALHSLQAVPLHQSNRIKKFACVQFEQRATAGFLVCVFFSGHGAVFDNAHYLLPVDFVPPPAIKAAALQEEKAEKAEADWCKEGGMVPLCFGCLIIAAAQRGSATD